MIMAENIAVRKSPRGPRKDRESSISHNIFMDGCEEGTNCSLITLIRGMMQTPLGEMIIKRRI